MAFRADCQAAPSRAGILRRCNQLRSFQPVACSFEPLLLASSVCMDTPSACRLTETRYASSIRPIVLQWGRRAPPAATSPLPSLKAATAADGAVENVGIAMYRLALIIYDSSFCIFVAGTLRREGGGSPCARLDSQATCDAEAALTQLLSGSSQAPMVGCARLPGALISSRLLCAARRRRYRPATGGQLFLPADHQEICTRMIRSAN